MPKPKSNADLKAENKLLREMLNNNRKKVTPKKTVIETIPKKIAAVEAHKHILAGRNLGAIGITSVTLTLIVMLIHSIAGTITAIGGIAILGWFTAMRSKHAQYLEEKYGLTPKPLINTPQQPPQNLSGFKGV